MPHEKGAGDTLSTRVRYHGFPAAASGSGLDRAGQRAPRAARPPAIARGSGCRCPTGPAVGSTVRWNIQAPAAGQRAWRTARWWASTRCAYGHTTWHYRLDTPGAARRAGGGGRAVRGDALLRAAAGAPVRAGDALEHPPDSAAAARAFRRAGEIVDFLTGVLGAVPVSRAGPRGVGAPADAGAPRRRSCCGTRRGRTPAGSAEDEIARATARAVAGERGLSESAAARRRSSGSRVSGGDVARVRRWAVPRRRDAPGRGFGARPDGEGWRGAWTLHELRGVMGDSAFASGLRALVAERRDGTASLDQVARIMSEASGREVGWVLRQGQGEVPAWRGGWIGRGTGSSRPQSCR